MTKVRDLQDVVKFLRERGAKIAGVDDLQPRYLGRGGEVGCPVPLPDNPDHTVWLLAVAVVRLGGQRVRAEAAEWLTWQLAEAGGELTVAELMDRYTARFTTTAPTWMPPQAHVNRVEQLSMLAYVADYMGFIANEFDEVMRLPADYPLDILSTTRERKNVSSPKGIDELVAPQLKGLRTAMTAVENGVGQDDDDDGWVEAYHASSRLLDAAQELYDRLEREIYEREL